VAFVFVVLEESWKPGSKPRFATNLTMLHNEHALTRMGW